MKKKLTALLTAAATAMTLAGCTVDRGGSSAGGGAGGGKQTFGRNVQLFDAHKKTHEAMKGKRIAFVPILYKGYNLTLNWGSTMERAFGNLGADFRVYDPNFDTDKMVKIINDLVARRAVDVLILHNPDVGVLTKQIDAAERAGIHTVVVNMVSSRLGDAFIGVDSVHAAEDITRRAVQDCEKRGAPKRMAIIDGPGNDAASLMWSKGVHHVLDPAGYEVVTTAHTQWQNALAQQAAASITQQQKNNICAYMVAYDLNAIAVGDAVADAAERGVIRPDSIGVYTMAADTRWCDALRAGKVTASAAYDVQGVGEAAVVTAQQLVQGGAPAGSTHTVAYVSHTVVDRSNVDDTTIACYKGR
ncbi:ABC transporter substrate-binding protein [Streptomyces viridiviolaceus]|uniref:Sugar ABC transporter substrate-binding protein n=1 Tax=Streptomyces viridiviolaceus TaxID=68282 RepID=A0ABW2EE67_9ACTN|nr:substrate-binding domain-containing protein [Streptomyces viridiviolaceus]GHB73974.1 ABC transporter substrate-binding protein [Streptomyces viridiviolaceus]